MAGQFPHVHTEPIKFDDEAKGRVLKFVRHNGRQIGLAARAGGIHRNTLMKHVEMNEEFAELFQNALDEYTLDLEAEAHRRAVQGIEEKIYTKDGDECGTKIIYSDRLLELLLKANAPEKYRENARVTHDIGGGVLVLPSRAPQAETARQLSDLSDFQEGLKVEAELTSRKPLAVEDAS